MMIVSLFLACFIILVYSQPQVIIDTDADIDDLWAIAYLMKSAKVDIKAITVSGDGWSDPIFSSPNIFRLFQMIGCPNHGPVAYGSNEYLNYLDPSGGPYGTVPLSLKVAIDRFMTNCLNLTDDNTNRPSPYFATELILGVLREATAPVDFLILGSCTNLARVLQEDRTVIGKLGTIYVSGGDYSDEPVKNSTWPYATITSGSSWNIFVDPVACTYVFQSGLPIVMITSPAQADLPVYASNIDPLVEKYSVPSILRNLVVLLAPCSDQDASDISYWDPSAAMVMEELQLGAGWDGTICTEWQNITGIVVLTVGGMFGRTITLPAGAPATICVTANLTSYEQKFWQTLGKTTVKCPLDYTITTPVGVTSLSASVDDLYTQIDALRKEVALLKANSAPLFIPTLMTLVVASVYLVAVAP